MRTRLLPIAFAAGCALLGSVELDACGDKFLRMGQALRLGRAPRPASILIYMQPDSLVPAAAKDLKLSAAMKQAGHRLHMVERESDLETALRSGAYDIVLGDVSAAALVRRAAHAAGPNPRFLPVFYKPTSQQLDAAAKQYGCFVAAPGKRYEILAEIDHVMEERHKAAKTPS